MLVSGDGCAGRGFAGKVQGAARPWAAWAAAPAAAAVARRAAWEATREAASPHQEERVAQRREALKDWIRDAAGHLARGLQAAGR